VIIECPQKRPWKLWRLQQDVDDQYRDSADGRSHFALQIQSCPGFDVVEQHAPVEIEVKIPAVPRNFSPPVQDGA